MSSPPPYQVPADSWLQILPGDEIVQVNEQVVVSGEERDTGSGGGEVKGLLSKTKGWWVGRGPWGEPCGDQACGSCCP